MEIKQTDSVTNTKCVQTNENMHPVYEANQEFFEASCDFITSFHYHSG